MKNLVCSLIIVFSTNSFSYSQKAEELFSVDIINLNDSLKNGYYAVGGNYSLIDNSFYIKFQIPDSCLIKIDLLSLQHQIISHLFKDTLNSGFYQVSFTPKNLKKIKINTSVYYLKFRAVQINRMNNLFKNQKIEFSNLIGILLRP